MAGGWWFVAGAQKQVMWTKMVGDSDKSGWWLSFFNSPF